MWASGDYASMVETWLLPLGPRLVEACAIVPGMHVLDVGAGTGNASIPAAQGGASVTASDLTRELVEGGGEQGLALARALDRGEQRAARVARDVAQRAERPGRDERVARAPEHPPVGGAGAGGSDERRLADARLADDDGDPPRVAGVLERARERRPLYVALEQLDPCPLPSPRAHPSRAPRPAREGDQAARRPVAATTAAWRARPSVSFATKPSRARRTSAPVPGNFALNATVQRIRVPSASGSRSTAPW
jgi:hypothetical protein